METIQNTLWFPRSRGDRQPSPWWYYGRAIFVSRHDYRKIFFQFISVGIPLGIGGLVFKSQVLWTMAFITGFLGLALLFFSLFGLFLQYGHPARLYFKKLLALESLPACPVVADIHIGTYRHSYMLHSLLPDSNIYSVDCRKEAHFSSELAVREVQALEALPADKNIRTIYTSGFKIPLPNNECDAVVFGFGTHELPARERNRLFLEARRILKPAGKLFLFEHGIDPLNYLIFGPVIHHVVSRNDWEQIINSHCGQVKQARLFAVNLFSAPNQK